MSTLGSIVPDSAARLRLGPHPDRARQDAESLLLHVLGKKKAWLIAHAEEPLASNQAAHYAELLERRYCRRTHPIHYRRNRVLRAALSRHARRADSAPGNRASAVEKALSRPSVSRPRALWMWAQARAPSPSRWPTNCLTRRSPRIDLSAPALELARKNAERNGVAARIRFLHGDLLAPVADEQFDIVVSNPPYVPTVDRASLAVEVRDYEPELALFAGDDGLAIYPPAHPRGLRRAHSRRPFDSRNRLQPIAQDH